MRVRPNNLWLAVFALALALPARGQDLLRVPVRDAPAAVKRALIVGVGDYQRADKLRTPAGDAETRRV